MDQVRRSEGSHRFALLVSCMSAASWRSHSASSTGETDQRITLGPLFAKEYRPCSKLHVEFDFDAALQLGIAEQALNTTGIRNLPAYPLRSLAARRMRDPGARIPTVHHFTNGWSEKSAIAVLAFGGDVEHRQSMAPAFVIEPNLHHEAFCWLERRLGTDPLDVAPGFVGLMGSHAELPRYSWEPGLFTA